MPQMLVIGSAGSLVRDLQQKLNSLPTNLVRLVVDGVFGPKTKSRVMEFQGQNNLSPDGVVGPLTWQQLILLISQVSGNFQNNLGRMAVVAVAKAEAGLGGVFAKVSGGPDPQKPGKQFRKGHDRLLKYFRIAAPKAGASNQTVFDENAIRYLAVPGQLAPMPHWCGIFALWAVKTAGMAVGTWVTGSGISSVTGFKQVAREAAAAGDVGYVGQPFQHHFIIEQVFDQNGVRVASTIEGNSAPSSNFSTKIRPLSSIDAFYTCF
jgi:peptidoglycan hydrolase-like protein with peptidoglycan-binding domain